MPDDATFVWGTFPFGRPNSKRPMRTPVASSAKALVVGVYPSAFHVAWTPPPMVDPRPEDQRRRRLIGSLAVDVEPVVFWDGVLPSPKDELERWKIASSFEDRLHGAVSVGNNGPSGAGLREAILTPLGLDTAHVAFRDAVPWFFVKSGRGSQGEAIESRFAPIAERLSVDRGSLPRRPSPSKLVQIAASTQCHLRDEVVEAGASLVITLGQEALDAIRAVADETAGVQKRLAPDGYGAVGEVALGRRRYQLMPLVHPGFQRLNRPGFDGGSLVWFQAALLVIASAA